MRFVIFGSGGFGRELIRPALENIATGEFPSTRLVFAADEARAPIFGVEVIAGESIEDNDRMVIAIGSSALRRNVANRYRRVAPGSLLARTALIGPGVTLGVGSVICDHSIVTASTRIGVHFQCNIYSYVAHDCVIGDFVTFAPRVCCNGNVIIEDGAYIGTGAILKQGTAENPLVIGMGATVGMGAVVTKNVPAGTTVVGNPAREL